MTWSEPFYTKNDPSTLIESSSLRSFRFIVLEHSGYLDVGALLKWMHFTFNYNLLSISTTTKWRKSVMEPISNIEEKLKVELHQTIIITSYVVSSIIAALILFTFFTRLLLNLMINPISQCWNTTEVFPLYICYNLFFATGCLVDLKQSLLSIWINTTCVFVPSSETLFARLFKEHNW